MMVKKGSYGYIRNRRFIMCAVSALMLAVILIMYFGARAHFGTNRNLFTIFAALCCIPAGKSIVSTIMYFLADGCPAVYKDPIDTASAGLVSAYDLYMTSYERNFVLWHTAVINGSVLIFAAQDTAQHKEPKRKDTPRPAGKKRFAGIIPSTPPDRPADVQEHIRTILANDGIKNWNVHVFTDADRYCRRVSECAENGYSDTWPEQGAERILGILKAVSL